MKRRTAGFLLAAAICLTVCSGCRNPLQKIRSVIFQGDLYLPKSLDEVEVNEKDLKQGKVTLPSYITPVFLTVSEKNRPGTKLSGVKNIVIHYVANPGTSALANRNYFERLSDPASNPDGIGASAHFIVGLSGEVVQCVPVTEVAYANYPRNDDTISIEVCHPEADGKFSDVTYQRVVELTAFLLSAYGLTADDVIRHYDISGKACPLYYVNNEDAWEQMKADINVQLESIR